MTNPSAAMPDVLQPTYTGFVRTSRDVCLLLEMSLSGRLPHVPRRPHERERSEIVKSGNIFIYEETASGVRRWTDGVNWSPSRILGNFLIYRETEQGFPGDGAKKTALKRHRGSTGSKPTGVRKNRSPSAAVPATTYIPYAGITQGSAALPCNYGMGDNELTNMEERDLYGSLIDSYPFKPGGLVKKTITVTVDGVPHHLVSYYKAEDVLSGKLKTPSMDPQFIGIQPRDSLLRNSTFRVPVEQEEYKINENSEAYITQDQAHVHGLYHPQHGYQPRALSMHNHGLPEHGLPPGGMAGMQAYGQSSFSFVAQPHLPAHAPTPLGGGIQGLGQNGMDPIGSGHYQQPSPQGFAPEGQEAYMPNSFQGGPPRHLSYSSTQSSAYAAPPTPGYPGPREYRQPSVTGTPNGYIALQPAGTPPNPSPAGRDIRGVAALEGDHGAIGWPVDYQNNAQVFPPSDVSFGANEHGSFGMQSMARAQDVQAEENRIKTLDDADGPSIVKTGGFKAASVSPVTHNLPLTSIAPPNGLPVHGNMGWLPGAFPYGADLEGMPAIPGNMTDTHKGAGVTGYDVGLAGPTLDNMDPDLSRNPAGEQAGFFGSSEWKWEPLYPAA